jgi:2-desacetyl-2-hydroxyethyl bacteriochlorophyllide A dehydrogenase
MQAVQYTAIDQVTVTDVPAPEVGPDEVRIRNRVVGICGSDTSIVHGKHPRAQPPLVLGHETAAVVESAGPGTDWSVGERVTLFPLITCGACWPCRHDQEQVCHGLNLYGIDAPGSMAELQTVPASKLVRLPDELDDRLAALVEPVAVAVHTINQADWSIADHVLMTGAGPIGVLTALAIRFTKQVDPILVEPDPVRRRMAEALGFATVDAMADDWVATAVEATGGEGADILFEASGAVPVAERMTDLVHARGQILIESIFKDQPTVDLRAVNFKEITLRAARCYQREDFDAAIALLGAQPEPFGQVITHEFAITDAPAAFAQMDAKGAALKVLIRV